MATFEKTKVKNDPSSRSRMVDGYFFLTTLVLDLKGSWFMVVKLNENPLGNFRSNLKEVSRLVSRLVKSKHWASTVVSFMLVPGSDIFKLF